MQRLRLRGTVPADTHRSFNGGDGAIVARQGIRAVLDTFLSAATLTRCGR